MLASASRQRTRLRHFAIAGLSVAVVGMLVLAVTACSHISVVRLQGGYALGLNGTDASGVEFANARDGWGFDGSILHTTDGGASWQKQTVPRLPDDSQGVSLTSLCAVDSQHAWAVGWVNPTSNVSDSTGFILGTHDGGVHWQVQHYQDSPTISDIAFADTRVGWAIGGPWPSMVLATTDGGAHWRHQHFPESDCDMSTVCTVDERHVWVQSAPDKEFASADGGQTWRTVKTGLPDKIAVTGGSWVGGDMQFLDAKHGWLVGGQDPSILRTTDGGISWRRERLPPLLDMRYLMLGGIHFSDSKDGWVTGEIITWPKKQNTYYYAETSDGGIHWRRVPPPNGWDP
jgi:photosystem II stability/assembly factor-like uncharacterized protein